jgi:hypothetical protein
LDAGIVPIYRGGSSIVDYLPPHSFINANDMSPGEVAELIRSLQSKPARYRDYFHWKTLPGVALGRDLPLAQQKNGAAIAASLTTNHTHIITGSGEAGESHNGGDQYHSGICDDGSFRCTVCSMYVHEQLKHDGIIL